MIALKIWPFVYWSYDAKNWKLDINFETKYDPQYNKRLDFLHQALF